MIQGVEQREIIIYASLHVAGQEMQVPITIPVGLDDLLEIVVQHLNDGTDLRQLLVAHYAQRVSQELQVEPPREERRERKEPRSRKSRPEQPPPGEAAAVTDELDAVDLEAPAPAYRGRGPKSRERQRWEAAMARAGKAIA
jgi:hypothetical protein